MDKKQIKIGTPWTVIILNGFIFIKVPRSMKLNDIVQNITMNKNIIDNLCPNFQAPLQITIDSPLRRMLIKVL